MAPNDRSRRFFEETTDPSLRLLGAYGEVWLRVVVLPPNREAFELIQTRDFSVGRAGFGNAGPIADSRLSREHARFRRKPDRAWEVVDQKSTNGTLVSGARVRRMDIDRPLALRVGDTVMLAEPVANPSGLPWLKSAADAELDAALERAAANDAPCLLLGPTGAGKTYYAEQIATRSTARTPFVNVNCGAIAGDLMDAELFGHAAGAFTGAAAARAGLVESAHGGTLFLDEIGTLAPAAQAKLLTCIETGTIRRVGETRTRRVDVRYIAATNLELKAAIEDGRFREDLYYRLGSQVIDIPPLAQRPFDVLRLTLTWLDADDHRMLSPNALDAILTYAWPGNVRELRNVVSTLPDAVEEPIRLQHLPERLRAKYSAAHETQPMPKMRRPTYAELADVLRRNGGNLAAAARELNTHRNQFARWCQYAGVVPSDFRES